MNTKLLCELTGSTNKDPCFPGVFDEKQTLIWLQRNKKPATEAGQVMGYIEFIAFWSELIVLQNLH